jgi:UDP-N-acetylglucosamine transferase subunit ALG13
VIFVTVGHELGFDRLIKAIDDWSHDRNIEVFAQIAEIKEDSYVPKNIAYAEFLTPQQFTAQFSSAELVISHAGMGTIITAQTMGKPLLIMPRRGHLQETRNDHQVATVEKFCSREGIFVAEDELTLPQAIESALSNADTPKKARASLYAEPSLLKAVRSFIWDQ